MKSAAPNPPMAEDPLERGLRASRTMEDASETLIQRAIDLWQPKRAAKPVEPLLSARRVWAALRFDSRATSSLALGLRSAVATDTQQLIFSAAGHDIDLRLTPVTNPDGELAWEVRGQVFGPTQEGTVELVNDEVSATRPWDELGEFCFDTVQPGHWRAVLRSAALEVETPPFELGVASRPAGRAGD